jgi:hypothetical protein
VGGSKGGEGQIDLRFDRFYGAYPRHEAKAAARAAFAKLAPDDELLERIIADASKRYVGVEPKVIPHPATYLNQRRWEDEHMPVAACSRAATEGGPMEIKLRLRPISAIAKGAIHSEATGALDATR